MRPGVIYSTMKTIENMLVKTSKVLKKTPYNDDFYIAKSANIY